MKAVMNYDEALEVLGCKSRDPLEAIRRRKNILAKKYHPDLNHKSGSEEKMAQINAAFDYIEQNYDSYQHELNKKERETAEAKKAQRRATTEQTLRKATGKGYQFTKNETPTVKQEKREVEFFKCIGWSGVIGIGLSLIYLLFHKWISKLIRHIPVPFFFVFPGIHLGVFIYFKLSIWLFLLSFIIGGNLASFILYKWDS